MGEMQTDGLVGSTAQFPGIPSALVADHVEVNGVSAGVSDFVARGPDVAKVVCCAEEAGVCFLVVEPLLLRRSHSSSSGEFSFRGLRCIWHFSDVREVLAWKALDSGNVLVIFE